MFRLRLAWRAFTGGLMEAIRFVASDARSRFGDEALYIMLHACLTAIYEELLGMKPEEASARALSDVEALLARTNDRPRGVM